MIADVIWGYRKSRSADRQPDMRKRSVVQRAAISSICWSLGVAKMYLRWGLVWREICNGERRLPLYGFRTLPWLVRQIMLTDVCQIILKVTVTLAESNFGNEATRHDPAADGSNRLIARVRRRHRTRHNITLSIAITSVWLPLSRLRHRATLSPADTVSSAMTRNSEELRQCCKICRTKRVSQAWRSNGSHKKLRNEPIMYNKIQHVPAKRSRAAPIQPSTTASALTQAGTFDL
jgi:hypothetical protein